jgi:DNA-directed RNA polymerase specialized sigma24 family protein
MQKMTTKELQGFQNEFEMTCAAQDGDGRAWLILWNHYRNMMMSRLIAAKGFSREELESEACEVFAYKLSLFNREKVSSENAFSMHSWLFCTVINKTNKLIRQRKKEVHLYFEDVNAADDRDGSLEDSRVRFSPYDETQDQAPLVNQMIGCNEEIYTTYNPERMVVEGLHEDDTLRVKTFYARLTQFERDILEARREGLTLAAVAQKFACSVTTVKNHIRTAKRYAEDIFQVCYA